VAQGVGPEFKPQYCKNKRDGGLKRMMEGVNLSMIYLIHCRNLCTCYNIPIPSTTIKEKKREKRLQRCSGMYALTHKEPRPANRHGKHLPGVMFLALP
jgi:hypothetical protein